jgi:CrcB protein
MWAAVAVAAAIGAVARYLLDQNIQRHHRQAFPWGTFVINVSGSVLLGLFTGLALHHGLSSSALSILGTGFCGGFTTFSTWIWESLALADGGSGPASALTSRATLNLLGTVVAGLAAAGAGLALALL